MIIPAYVSSPTSFVNTNLFREEAAHFEKYGAYCKAEEGTIAYREYWDEQERRCKEGYTVAGIRITGEHYSYLNFARIKITIGEGKNARKHEAFPRFLDMDFYYYHELEQAKDNRQGMIVAKSRRKGFSYKGGWNCTYEYIFYRDSLSIIAAFMGEYANFTMGLALDMINFINKHTDFAKRKLIDTRTHIKSGFKEKVNNIEVESGFKSEIMSISFKDNPFKSIGKSASVMLFEEAGKWRGLIDAYILSKPLFMDGDLMVGIPVIYGTGGDMEDGTQDFCDMFYNPESYNLRSYKNVWDENAVGECGWFVDDLWFKAPYVDKNGNSDRVKAEEALDVGRDMIRKSGNKRAYEKFITQNPKCLHPDTIISRNGKTDKIKNFDEKYDNGIQDLYKIITENGRELICTKEHHLYNGSEYKSLSLLKEGDIVKLYPYDYSNNEYQNIEIKTNLNCLSSKLKIEEDLALLLGYYFGDGSFYGKNFNYGFDFVGDSQDSDIIEIIVKVFEKYFDKLNISFPKNKRMFRLRSTNKEYKHIVDCLELIENRKNGSDGIKRKINVPSYIFKSPESVIASFLKGLFEADSFIGSKNKIIRISQKKTEFVKEIMLLLQGFGIYGKYREYEVILNKKKYPQCSLELNVDEVDIFNEKIGFLSKRKINKLSEHCIKKSKARIDRSIDKIKSINYYSTDQVYDITADKSCYGAGGIWTHNSPAEAFLRTTGNIFPVADLLERLAYLNTHKNITDADYIGELVFNEKGDVEWKNNDRLYPIKKFPHKKSEDNTGCVVIYEMPYVDDNGVIPYNRYIAGLDPYRQDKAEYSDSIGSTFIFNRLTQRIVAEYSGRPETAKDYYEVVRRLVLFYNASLMYENEVKGPFEYFDGHGCLYLLADEPKWIKDMIPSSTVSRKKGMHMNVQIKEYCEELIKQWLLSESTESGIINLHKIRSVPLLQELISYDPDPKKNFDRVMSLGMVMGLNLEKRKVKADDEQKKNRNVLDSEFFTSGFKVNFK